MLRMVALLLVVGTAAFGQYTADASREVPSEVAPAIQQALEKNGFQISHDTAPYCEIWFRSNPPTGAGASGRNVTISTIPAGALVGVIRFDGPGLDRRGQAIPAGVYTLRYGVMPMNSAHEGAAPHRDFFLLAPASSDRDPASIPGFDALVSLSKKASLTAHPAVLSVWKADSDTTVFSQQGDDWVLQTKLGDTPIAVILVGTGNS
jgi:hypothetical protein